MDQATSKPPNGSRDFLLVQFQLQEALRSFITVQPLSPSSQIILDYPFPVAHHNMIGKRVALYVQK